jgi:hypothetical protein
MTSCYQRSWTLLGFWKSTLGDIKCRENGVSTFLKQRPRSAIAEHFSYLLVSAITVTCWCLQSAWFLDQLEACCPLILGLRLRSAASSFAYVVIVKG